ncbi:MAG: sigma-70 family RNA polymerase sigma factor [Bacillus sp. (in: firmicutes)]
MNKRKAGAETKVFKKFREENSRLFENEIVQEFLKIEHHYQLLVDAINHPTKTNKDKVDIAFKKHYFTIRFTSYLSKSIYFKAVNFHHKQNVYKSRYPLLLDAEKEIDGNSTYKDQLDDKESEIERYVEKRGLRENVAEYVEDPLLYKAIQSLTNAQQNILYYAYVQKCKDTDIALQLNKSQQYISKTHKTALKRIHQFLLKNEGEDA